MQGAAVAFAADSPCLNSYLIVPDWVKLKCQVGEKYIRLVMCGLAGFSGDLGLDKIFWAEV